MNTGLQNIIRGLLIVLWFVSPLSAGAAEHMLIIDPAHGGTDTGVKLSRTVYEKDVTLAIALDMKERLSKTSGITIRLTRSGDTDLTLAERKNILRQSNADLGISLHVNAGFGLNAEGYEVYYLGITAPSASEHNSGEIVNDMAQTRCFNNSVLFAQMVQRNMEQVFPRRGRGLREAPVHLLQALEVPAILLEIGFSTKLEEKKQLREDAVQKAVADALTHSVKEYFSMDGSS